MDGFIRLALIVSLATMASGCQSLVASRDFEKSHLAGAAKSNPASSPTAHAAPAAATPAPAAVDMSAAAPMVATATATDLAGAQAATQPAAPAANDEITSTLDQLQAAGKLSPESRQRLQNDLAQCDPSLLPSLLKMLQGSVDVNSPSLAAGSATTGAVASSTAAAGNAAEQTAGIEGSSRRRYMNNAGSVTNPYADVTPGGAANQQPTNPVQLASAQSEEPAVRQPGEPAPFPESRPKYAPANGSTRRLPPAPEEVFAAYETLLAAKYPDTGAPELLAAIAAAKPLPQPSAGPVKQAIAEESADDEPAGRSRGEEAMLASFVREVEPAAKVTSVPDKASAGGLDNASWEELLTTFIQRLENTSRGPAETTDQLRQQVYLRLLYVMAGRREDALEPIAGLSLAEQEFWNKFIYGLTSYLDENRIPNRQQRAAEARQYFRDAAVRLGELATLEVRGLTFCTAVRSYGVVEPFPTNTFKPGDVVLLYAELDNFVAQRQAEGFRTEFRASYLIYDRLGRPVETEPHELPVITETCQNLRHDFFISYQVELPTRMNPGEHKMQLTVHDMVGNKVGTAEVKFMVEK